MDIRFNVSAEVVQDIRIKTDKAITDFLNSEEFKKLIITEGMISRSLTISYNTVEDLVRKKVLEILKDQVESTAFKEAVLKKFNNIATDKTVDAIFKSGLEYFVEREL